MVLCDRVAAELGVTFDRERVLAGAALHDAGKIVHPKEMQAPGSRHEPAGEQLLLANGVDPAIARCCVTHASWNGPDITIEDLLVALADKLWKGRRDDALERRTLGMLERATGRPAWEVFAAFDAICEAIAADGPARLARSTA